MIEETYVSFDIAKLLKEKGFGECSTSYISEDGDIFPTPLVKRKEHYPAPTQQMAMRWLREVHGIFIEVNCNCNNLELTCTISKVEDDFGDKVYEDVGFYFQTYSYEEAVEEALKYCLENIL